MTSTVGPGLLSIEIPTPPAPLEELAETADAAVRPQPREADMSTVHRIVFTPSGLEAQAADGASVLEVARTARVDLDSVCGGRGACGRCQIIPSFGEFPKWALKSEPLHLSEVGATEANYQGRRFVPDGSRLGCQAKIYGPIVVEVPPESQLHAPIIRKEINLNGLSLDPVSSLRVVTVSATQVKSVGVQAAINEACQQEWHFVPESYESDVLEQVDQFVGDVDETVTLHLRQTDTSTTVHSVRKGVRLDNLGVAIDLGSTTVAAHLIDLGTGEILTSGGLMNPQIRLGEDLMSRVSYVMMNPDGGDELTGLAREAVAGLIDTLLEDADRSVEDVTEVVLVGNPVMHHSFLGFDVVTIKSDENGRLNFEDFKEKVDENFAAAMITNPNTCGLFEDDIIEIANYIHDAGGYLYCDGANFNALVGKVRPGDLGIDAMHINLHKTFCIPHGGGGPGSGPVVFSSILKDFCPAPLLKEVDEKYYLVENNDDEEIDESFGRLCVFHGQMGMFVRALSYMMSHGSDGLRQVSEDAVLNANYIKSSLEDILTPAYDGYCMHEVLFNDDFLSGTGVETIDFAKALIDKGYHPMTIYFPLVVHGALLVEPTETESKNSLDQFIGTIRELAIKIHEDDEFFKKAPIYTPIRRLDETKAARNPVLRWQKNEVIAAE